MWVVWELVGVIFFLSDSEARSWTESKDRGKVLKVWEDRSYKTDIEEIRSMKEIEKCHEYLGSIKGPLDVCCHYLKCAHSACFLQPGRQNMGTLISQVRLTARQTPNLSALTNQSRFLTKKCTWTISPNPYNGWITWIPLLCSFPDEETKELIVASLNHNFCFRY